MHKRTREIDLNATVRIPLGKNSRKEESTPTRISTRLAGNAKEEDLQ